MDTKNLNIPNKWNLELLYKDINDPQIQKDLDEINNKSYEFISKWKDRTDYLEDSKILKEALDEFNTWSGTYRSGGNPQYFFELNFVLNQNDPKIKAKLNKSEDSLLKILNDIQFFMLNLAKVSEEKQKIFLDSELLKDYRHFLERLFIEQKYLLSDKEEQLMNLKSSPSYTNWVNMTSGLLSKQEKKVLTEEGTEENKSFTEILSLLSSTNKKVRDTAAVSFNQILKDFSDMAEHEINAILTNHKIDDQVRNFPRPDASRHLSDDIETEVVDSLIKSVTQNFYISQKFYELKSKLLNVPKLEYHERSVPYGKIDVKYSYEDSVKLISKVFQRLDPEFASIFNNFVHNGQMDVYPKPGKTGGAVCYGHLITNPTFILLNHTDKLNDVLTIAHESGHGINNELIRKYQKAINYETPLSTAEVASTFMEDFVLQDILENADEELRLALQMMKLNDDISTIFRQVACYNFETDLHKNLRDTGYLSSENISHIFQKNMIAYMGDFVEQSEGSQNWWIYWSHIRRFFYVYSYASGLLISKSLQSQVKRDPQYINKVKSFLSAGTADSPKNIFKNCGIDIQDKTFWDNGIQEVKELLDDTTQLAQKLGKI